MPQPPPPRRPSGRPPVRPGVPAAVRAYNALGRAQPATDAAIASEAVALPASMGAGRGAVRPQDLEPVPRRAGPRSIVAVAAVVLTLLLVTGAGVAALARPDVGRTNAALTATHAAVTRAQSEAARGDVDAAVAGLDAAARSAPGDERLLLRDAAASLLAAASGEASAAGRDREAVGDAERAASYDDTAAGRTARRQLPGVLLESARQLVAAHDPTDTAATWLHRVVSLAAGTAEARVAASVLAASTPVHGRLSIAGAPAAGAEVVLDPSSGPAAPGGQPPRQARAQTDAVGAFNLGLVVPARYTLTYRTAGAQPRQPGAGGTVVVDPARDVDLELNLPG